jgi:hypothetical protein
MSDQRATLFPWPINPITATSATLRKEDKHPCRNPLGLVGSLCVLLGEILWRRNIAGLSQAFD